MNLQRLFFENIVYPLFNLRGRFEWTDLFFFKFNFLVEAHDSYFVWKRDVAGILGLSTIQKVIVAVRILVYRVAADAVDDYVRIAKVPQLKVWKVLLRQWLKFFGDDYLRPPNNDDISILLAQGASHGFLRMFVNIDYMHWKWENCLVVWKGMYVHGDIHDPSMILEAFALYDLWIWHVFFGLSGSHNDINVSEWFSLFADLAEGRAPVINY